MFLERLPEQRYRQSPLIVLSSEHSPRRSRIKAFIMTPTQQQLVSQEAARGRLASGVEREVGGARGTPPFYRQGRGHDTGGGWCHVLTTKCRLIVDRFDESISIPCYILDSHCYICTRYGETFGTVYIITSTYFELANFLHLASTPTLTCPLVPWFWCCRY